MCITQECDDPCCNATVCSLKKGAFCYTHEACCQNCQVSVSPLPTAFILRKLLVICLPLLPLHMTWALCSLSQLGCSVVLLVVSAMSKNDARAVVER